MKKLTSDIKIRKCCRCKVPKALEFGYYVNNNNPHGYSYACKICEDTRATELRSEKRNGIYKKHFWSPTDKDDEFKCDRCQVIKRRKAHPYKAGAWLNKYLVEEDWVKQMPVCQDIRYKEHD